MPSGQFVSVSQLPFGQLVSVLVFVFTVVLQLPVVQFVFVFVLQFPVVQFVLVLLLFVVQPELLDLPFNISNILFMELLFAVLQPELDFEAELQLEPLFLNISAIDAEADLESEKHEFDELPLIEEKRLLPLKSEVSGHAALAIMLIFTVITAPIMPNINVFLNILFIVSSKLFTDSVSVFLCFSYLCYQHNNR